MACLKTDALFSMAHRYCEKARSEKDLAKAEVLTEKAIEWYDRWIVAKAEIKELLEEKAITP